MTILQGLLSIASGSLVGFTLGLVGGGGSILAVPLLVYVVGVPSPHVAIGTSAVAVAVSAAANLAGHARAKTVKWPCAIVFALAGIAGAAGGAQLGKLVDGGRLLALFGVLMVIIGLAMLRPRKSGGNLTSRSLAKACWGWRHCLLQSDLQSAYCQGFSVLAAAFSSCPGS